MQLQTLTALSPLTNQSPQWNVTDNISTVKLPSSDVAVGTTVTPTGWGRPSDSKCFTSFFTAFCLAIFQVDLACPVSF